MIKVILFLSLMTVAMWLFMLQYVDQETRSSWWIAKKVDLSDDDVYRILVMSLICLLGVMMLLVAYM